MRKVITILLYNRPTYTKALLTALRRCDGIGQYQLLFHIEPGRDDVIALAKAVDFAETKITINKQKLGISQNTYKAWEHGFKKSDFIIHFEDDTVPAPDC